MFNFRKRSNNKLHFFKEKPTRLDYDINRIVHTKYNDYQSLERANTADSDNSTITCTMNHYCSIAIIKTPQFLLFNVPTTSYLPTYFLRNKIIDKNFVV